MIRRNLLLPAGVLFESIARLRNLAFDKNWLRSEALPCRVIGIGNVTVGGTGKTPVTEIFVRRALEQSIRVGVVSRGYGGNVKGIGEVGAGDGIYFGDEPEMMAAKFPGVPFYVGAQRAQAAMALLKKHPVKVLIADDSFQHRRLQRDFNVLVIDSTQALVDYRPLPWGLAREPLPHALKRADMVVVTKSDLLSEDEQRAHKKWLSEMFLMAKFDKNLVFVEYDIETVYSLAKGRGNRLDLQKSERVFLVSGLGRPESFARLVRAQTKFQVEHHRCFADHHPYTQADIDGLQSQWEGTFLITEKDAIKIGKLRFEPDRWWVLGLKVRATTEGEVKIDQVLHRLTR